MEVYERSRERDSKKEKEAGGVRKKVVFEIVDKKKASLAIHSFTVVVPNERAFFP